MEDLPKLEVPIGDASLDSSGNREGLIRDDHARKGGKNR